VRSIALAVASAALLSFSSLALAHRRPVDGGIAKRGCSPVFGQRVFVAATRVSCTTARNVVRTVVQHPRRRLRRWRCTLGRRAARGHCHRRGHPRRIVHWTPGDKPTEFSWQTFDPNDPDTYTELYIQKIGDPEVFPENPELQAAVRAGKWFVAIRFQTSALPGGCQPGTRTIYVNSKERPFYILDRRHYSFRLQLPMDRARDGIGGTFLISARRDGLGRFPGYFRVRGQPFDCSGTYDTGIVHFVATR
jgi:hypothetical protein